MFGPIIVGTIRTVVPTFVGVGITFIAQKSGVDFSQYADFVVSGVVATITGMYYFGVTWLERNVHPTFGVLLGIPKPPSYSLPEAAEVPEAEEVRELPAEDEVVHLSSDDLRVEEGSNDA